MAPLFESLLHVLWQGAALWALREAIDGLFADGDHDSRYIATLATLLALLLSWLGTWMWLTRGGVGSMPVAPSGWAAWGVALWASGATLAGIRTSMGLWTLHAFAARATPAAAQLQQRLEALADVAGVHQAVRLLTSTEIDGPMVVGWLRPVILVPPALLLSIPAAQLEAILFHELAHIRRHDWAFGLAIAGVETVLFHVPFVWLLAARARQEREECCDAAAARWSGDATLVARALLTLEEQRGSHLQVAANGGSLMSRIERLVRPPAQHRPLRSVVQLLLLGALCTGTWACSLALTTPAHATPAWLPERVSRWTPMIEETARTHGIDPDLLAIVVLIESRGNADATSSMGARGLTQVMPATTARIAKARGLETPTSEEMANPKLNLDFGAWYLAQQLEAYGSDVDDDTAVARALVAYNGGPKAVRTWMATGTGLSTETEAYLDIGLSLWKERDASRSATLESQTR